MPRLLNILNAIYFLNRKVPRTLNLRHLLPRGSKTKTKMQTHQLLFDLYLQIHFLYFMLVFNQKETGGGGGGSVFIKGDVTWDDSQQPAIFSAIQGCKPFETIERLRFHGYSEHTFVPREIFPFKERITWLKSPFFSWQAIWALKCVRQRLNESLKISKFTRICMKYHSSVAGWQEFSRGRCNRFFWDIRLKIYRLLNFNMLFQFLRTEFSKSKLFSCSQKFDHVTNYCKRPIRFFKRRFRLLSPWNFATMATWRNDYPFSSSWFEVHFDCVRLLIGKWTV